MIFDVFTLTFNEDEVLPDFLRHYSFARRIVILDNESTDRTREIAQADSRVVLIPWSSGGTLRDGEHIRIKNHIWKWSDADYVVVVDVDEFVDCSLVAPYVAEHGRQDVAFKCLGHDMLGVDGQSISDIRRFRLSHGYNKIAVFSPRIAGVNYEPGCHGAKPTCPVVTEPHLILRHYSNLGEEYAVRKWKKAHTHPRSQENRDKGWGIQSDWEEDRVRAEYRAAYAGGRE